MGGQPINHLTRLREKAEQVLKSRAADSESVPKKDVRALIDDIQVYQVELEIQNEELRQAQKQLEASRDRLFLLYHQAPAGYLVIDKAGMIVDANQTMADLLAMERQAILKKPVSRLICTDDQPLFLSAFKSFLNKPENKNIQVRLARSNGTCVHVRLAGHLLSEETAPDSRLAGQMLVVISDVSEIEKGKRHLEQALADENRKTLETKALLACSRAILEFNDFSVTSRAIFDAARELIGATAGYVALLSADGAENELLFLEAGGRPCSVDPELPMPIRGLRAEAYRTGRTVYDNHFMDSEWIQFMPAGHVTLDNVLFAPLVLDGNTLGILGLSNKPGGFTATDAEIAGAFGDLAAIALRNSRLMEARDAAVASLEDSQRHLADILESITDGFFALDDQLNVTYFNQAAAEMLGCDAPSIIGQHLFEAFPQARGSIFERKYKQALREKRNLAFETYFGVAPFANWYDVRVYPTDAGISVYFQVTTRKKEFEAYLRHAHKMESLGALTGGVAHEFNNLLGVIVGHTELALEDTPAHDPVAARLTEIYKASMRAGKIVRQLLGFSRGVDSRQETVDLGQLIQESTGMLSSKLPEAFSLNLAIPDAPLQIAGDAGYLRQVLENLISNATEAMADTGGTISIQLEAIALDAPLECFDATLYNGSYVRLRVADNGAGIRPEILEHVFDPFYTSRSFGENAGMGLAVVHGIMKSHRGAVRINSQPGQGTEVDCYFPASGDPAEHAEPDPAKAAVDEIKVFYLDDDAAVLKVSKLRLERLGYRVETESDPEAAVARFEKNPKAFDVVITELTMPKLTGDRVIQAVRKINPDVRTILCTGFDEHSNREKMQAIGADGLLPKPHSQHELAEAILNVLASPADAGYN